MDLDKRLEKFFAGRSPLLMLTAKDAAKELYCVEITLRNMVKRGEILVSEVTGSHRQYPLAAIALNLFPGVADDWLREKAQYAIDNRAKAIEAEKRRKAQALTSPLAAINRAKANKAAPVRDRQPDDLTTGDMSHALRMSGKAVRASANRGAIEMAAVTPNGARLFSKAELERVREARRCNLRA